MRNFFKKISTLFVSLFLLMGIGLVSKTQVTKAALTYTGNYEQVKSVSALATGDKVIIGDLNGDFGMGSGWNGSKDAKVSKTESDWIQYEVTVSGSNFTLKDPVANSFIASPGSSNRFIYGSAGNCVLNANGVLGCNNRYLCKNGNYYRMYSNVGSYKPFYVYKVIEQNIAVTGINVTTTSFTLDKGQTAQIEASVLPADATEQGITYTVDAGFENSISVDSNGLITANAAVENATITVKTNDGGFEQKVTVTVNAPTAAATIALIDAIGVVEYTPECKEKIDAARLSYDNLGAELQGTVSNYNVLTAAEAEYARLEAAAIEAADKAKAAEVDAMIDAIGEITDYSKKSQIVAAREAYNALTDVQKGYVTKLATLEAAETAIETYKPLMYYIDTGVGKSEGASAALSTGEQLESKYTTPDGISWISGTKAYGSSTQCLKLGSSSVLGSAELKLDSSDYYVTKVTVNAKAYGSDSSSIYVNEETPIALTSSPADYVFDISASQTQTITFGATGKRAYVYSLTVEYAKFDTTIDQAAVNDVIAKINAIGTVEPTLAVMSAIEVAEKAYNELKSAEQALVTNYATLTAARTDFDALVVKADKVEGIGTSYAPATVTIGSATFDVNIAGNSSSIGFNKNNKAKAVTSDEAIANAIGVDTTRTGVVTMHSYFYDGFISYTFTASDVFTGTAYLLTSADGGKTYSIHAQKPVDTTSEKDLTVKTSISGTTDMAIVLVLDESIEAARVSLASTTYYDKLVYSSDLQAILDMLAEMDSCKDYNEAATLSEMLAELPERDQVLFSRATVEDIDGEANIIQVNAADKLSYMANLAATKANEQAQVSQNLMAKLGKRGSMLAILVIGGIGLVSILGYYFIQKKRYAR